jgi:serine/threonine-protein kinase HipA
MLSLDEMVARYASYADLAIDRQIAVIEAEWGDDVCQAGRLTEVDRDYFWRRQFLNPYALEGYGSA